MAGKTASDFRMAGDVYRAESVFVFKGGVDIGAGAETVGRGDLVRLVFRGKTFDDTMGAAVWNEGAVARARAHRTVDE